MTAFSRLAWRAIAGYSSFSQRVIASSLQAPEAYGATITYDIPLAKKAEIHRASPQPAQETAQQLMVRLAQTIA